jgi:hypothetical protein
MQARFPLDEEDKRRLILKLVKKLRCAECGRFYNPDGFVLVRRWQDVWVLSTRCQFCDDSCHVVVLMRLDAEPEPAIDLTREELAAANDWPPITADDVLDVHVFLEEFDGDFEALFTG